jgi:hypothetical protein
VNKKFDQKLCDQSDPKSKALIYSFLRQRFPSIYELIPISDQTEAYSMYDLEIVDKRSGSNVYLEVEQKIVWFNRGMWQGWDTVDIPYRKRSSKADFFFLINKWFDTFLVIEMDVVKGSRLIYKNTKYTSEEPFFSVPVELFTMVYKNSEGLFRKIDLG